MDATNAPKGFGGDNKKKRAAAQYGALVRGGWSAPSAVPMEQIMRWIVEVLAEELDPAGFSRHTNLWVPAYLRYLGT